MAEPANDRETVIAPINDRESVTAPADDKVPVIVPADDRVSIIVPVYNTDISYLEECLNSILAQSHKDMELIIVNDGSRKEVGDYLTKFCKEHNGKPRGGEQRDEKLSDGELNNGGLRDGELHNGKPRDGALRDGTCIYIDKHNEGVSVARYDGLMRATGKYVMFVDSDDSLAPDAVSVLLDTLKANSTDAAIAEDYVRDMPDVTKYSGNKDILTALLDNKEAAFGWALWGKIFKTGIMRECYIKYPDIYYGEDLLENALYFEKAESVVIINKALYNYRRDNDNSATHNDVTPKKLSLIDMWQEMGNIYKRQNLDGCVSRIEANYYDSVLSGYLQCAYYKFDSYREKMRTYRAILKKNMRAIRSNPYVRGRGKYMLAVYALWVFKLKRLL